MDSRNTIINTYLQSAHGLHLHGFTACFVCLQSARLHDLLACMQSATAWPPLLAWTCSPGLLACFTACLLCFTTACQEASLFACFASRKKASRPRAQDQERAPVAPRARGGAPASVRETARGEWASGGCRLELVWSLWET
jgi:hypothetical protein